MKKVVSMLFLLIVLATSAVVLADGGAPQPKCPPDWPKATWCIGQK